jgi:hypothetical protein
MPRATRETTRGFARVRAGSSGFERILTRTSALTGWGTSSATTTSPMVTFDGAAPEDGVSDVTSEK